MTAKKRNSSKDSTDKNLERLDAHEIKPEEYDELPELTDDDFARGTWSIGGKPVSEAEGAETLAGAIRPGRPRSQNPKLAVNIRLSPDVVAAFRASGPGWQTRIDQALREWLEQHPEHKRA
jgi:uncharacterized protein (DUF4415 family)